MSRVQVRFPLSNFDPKISLPKFCLMLQVDFGSGLSIVVKFSSLSLSQPFKHRSFVNQCGNICQYKHSVEETIFQIVNPTKNPKLSLEKGLVTMFYESNST